MEKCNIKYYYWHKDPHTGKFIRVEREVRNPLPGITFVSIAYYRNPDGSVYAIVM